MNPCDNIRDNMAFISAWYPEMVNDNLTPDQLTEFCLRLLNIQFMIDAIAQVVNSKGKVTIDTYMKAIERRF